MGARSSRLARFGVLACLELALACSGGSSGGGGGPKSPFTFLTLGNLGGEDDDPAVAVDDQGNIHVVWFSDRDGTKDLYHVRSTGIDLSTETISWTSPVQITHLDAASYPPPTQGDNYPALAIDADGTLNVAWHRWNLQNESHVMFLRSDGTPQGWAAAAEVAVTGGANFDQFPEVVRFAPGDLRIYFASTTRKTPGVYDLFVTDSADDGGSWGAPMEVASLNSGAEQTSFVSIAQRSASDYVAALDRWDVGSGFLDPSSDVFYASSSDGDTWTVQQVSMDPADERNDFSPTLYFDHAGAPGLAWASTAFGDRTADVVQVPVSGLGSYPASAGTPNPAAGIVDHSPEIVALTVGGEEVFVLVWVRIAAGHNQVGYTILFGL